jgi:hypothetical protein
MSSRSIISLVSLVAFAAGAQLVPSSEVAADQSLTWKIDAGALRLTAKPDQAYLAYTAKKRPAAQLAQDQKLMVQHFYRQGTEVFRPAPDEVVVVLAPVLVCGPTCRPCGETATCLVPPPPPPPGSLGWLMGK